MRKTVLCAIILLLATGMAGILEKMPTSFKGKPKIFYCDRVLIPLGPVPEEVMKIFLDPTRNLDSVNWNVLGARWVTPEPVPYSCRRDVGRCFHEGKVCYRKAVEGEGWRIQWGIYECDTNRDVQAACGEPTGCAIYFTGIGCPHCAVTDPWLFYEFLPKNPLVVIEYEIYKTPENPPVMNEFVAKYNLYPGIPQVVFDENHVYLGEVEVMALEPLKICSSQSLELIRGEKSEKKGFPAWILILPALAGLGLVLVLITKKKES